MLKNLSCALHRTVDGVKRWIEGNLYKKMPTQYISEVSGYCGRYLREGFKKITGMSLVRYIRLRKLTEAAHLLRLTGRPITEIAMLYAFSSLQCFSRAFSRHFGIS
ncbi:helix-turn-helix transcriptional regulator, partial [Salmonella enterica]|nr:helix-turn-helix transcriptional regulator [Salmonella enterica]